MSVRTLSVTDGPKTLIAAGVMQADGAVTVLYMHWSGKWKVGVLLPYLVFPRKINGKMGHHMHSHFHKFFNATHLSGFTHTHTHAHTHTH